MGERKIKASTAERRWMENPVSPSCVTPAGMSIEVQNDWEENNNNKNNGDDFPCSSERSRTTGYAHSSVQYVHTLYSNNL